MVDLAISQVCLAGRDEPADVLITGGKITAIRNHGDHVEAKNFIHANGALLSPGFVDSHTHLDKTGVRPASDSTTLDLAIKNYTDYVSNLSPGQLAADIKMRARETLRKAVLAGTTSLRTHVNVDARSGLEIVRTLNELRDEMRPYIDIQITALPGFRNGPEHQQARMNLLDAMARDRLIDAIGGAAHLQDNRIELTRELFEIAVRNDIDVDFHIDEHDDPNIDTFLETAHLTLKYNYEGRVSCSHITALCRVDDGLAAEAIAMAKEARLHIITLPSCNLYLMARTDRQPIPRGVTRIKEFLEAGVNIVYASDNIRDPFRPIGNADMLEEGLLTGQVAQMLSDSELRVIHQMGTIHAARAMRLDDYGLAVGRRADLVLLDASDIASAYRDQATRLTVIKNGRVVATNQRTSYVAF
ncbi:MAG TPA: amidohydrolase family protein [Clostridia bacterium]|nr:amidohydrolase family protein [Clostridia bacterium]